jgi:hypothetical protein
MGGSSWEVTVAHARRGTFGSALVYRFREASITMKPILSQHSPMPCCDGSSTGIAMTMREEKMNEQVLTQGNDFQVEPKPLNPRTCTYADFVRGLFVKPDDLPGRLHHAATGMIGEAVELKHHISWANLVEEAGDWEFYYQAFWNTKDDWAKHCIPANISPAKYITPDGLRASFDQLIHACADVLDLTKKIWIYGEDVNKRAEAMVIALMNARYGMEGVYRHTNLTYPVAIAENRSKLLIRYPGGGYTDKAAQDRADKQGVA